MTIVRLTVVMPVYNEAATVATVLEDVTSDVLDVVENSELVVIDDRSTDETPAILEAAHESDQRIRVLTNESNRGHGRSVRRGIDESTGEWILHLDSDGQIELAFRPRVEYAGWNAVTHGGLIATVLDEVMTWAAIVESDRACFAADFSVRCLVLRHGDSLSQMRM